MNTCLLVSFVLPESIDKLRKEALLRHLSIFLKTYGRSGGKLGLYILTNEINIVKRELSNLVELRQHIIVDAIEIEDLYYCTGHDGEYFEFAFSKLDALAAINKVLDKYHDLKTIILSDIDTCILNGERLESVKLDKDRIHAIDYRDEQNTSGIYDQLMKDLGKAMNYDQGLLEYNQIAWINSGFVVIPAKIVPGICAKLQKGIDYMRANKYQVKNSCANHYGDEILLSAVFNYEANCPIGLYSHKYAQLIWTCYTANNTFRWVPLLDPPGHLHLPALKFLPRQLDILELIANSNFACNLRIACVINLFSIETRYVDTIKMKNVRRIIKVLFVIAYKIIIA